MMDLERVFKKIYYKIINGLHVYFFEYHFTYIITLLFPNYLWMFLSLSIIRIKYSDLFGIID